MSDAMVRGLHSSSPDMRTGRMTDHAHRGFGSDAGGFSLMEVLFATALLAGAIGTLVELMSVAARSNRLSRGITTAAGLASQKLEQLRSLAWYYDTSGAAISDTSSDLTVAPPAATGGPGLSPASGAPLLQNTPGYVDYLDAQGHWLGTGAEAPRGTVYIRRWAITPLPASPTEALVLRVLVTRLAAAIPPPAVGPAFGAADVLMTSLKARKSE
jgi:hypothetical protein